MIASRLLSSVWTKRAATRLFSSLHKNNTQNSATPLIEKYRNSWPDKPFLQDDITTPIELPPRTVDAKKLSFEFSARYDHGASIYYPHMNMHPADFKVVMEVSIDDLNLSEPEKEIMIRMIGNRYKPQTKLCRFTSRRFPNRIENKRYLVVLLENLIAETKRLETIRHKFV